MKRLANLCLGVLFFCLLVTNGQAQKLVEDVKISSENATLQMADQTPQSYFLEIVGPGNYYWKNQVDDAKSISVSNLNAKGVKFDDGLYKLQVTPILKLTAEQKTELLEIRNDEIAMTAYRQENNLPAQVNVYNISFSIRNGKFVTPDQKEAKLSMPSGSSAWVQDHPAIYASLNPVGIEYGKPVLASDNRSYATDNSLMNEDAQVFTQDVVVQGSICIGLDCVNGESFGFDTQRLKENNLRIHFNDTSNSASFPGNDWRISINSSDNGGGNYFAIEDVDGGKTPFRIEAGAQTNTLYVEADGDVGIKTANPVVDLHMVEGNTPTMRLEQDGSDGFTPQTWDVAGNETNFFIRDATNGSKLPFKIKPGAPDDALFIAADGDIGMGAGTNPSNSLHVKRTNGTASILVEETNSSASSVLMALESNSSATTEMLTVKNNSTTASNRTLVTLENNGGNRLQFNNTDPADASEYTFGLNNGGLLIMSRIGVSGTAFAVDANNDVGVKTTSPDFDFEVEGTAGKTGGGIWSTPSDLRLKTNINDFTLGLEDVLKIRPVSYNFNGKMGLPTDKEYVGIIAQEMQKIAPFMITEKLSVDDNGVSGKYLSYDGSALSYMLINAVKTQNEKIEQQAKEIKELQNQLTEVEQLRKEVAALAELVKRSAKN